MLRWWLRSPDLPGLKDKMSATGLNKRHLIWHTGRAAQSQTNNALLIPYFTSAMICPLIPSVGIFNASVYIYNMGSYSTPPIEYESAYISQIIEVCLFYFMPFLYLMKNSSVLLRAIFSYKINK